MLNIDTNSAEITSLNIRKEFHGDDERLAVDIGFRADIMEAGLTVMKELAPALAGVMWKDNGDPHVSGVSMQLDHKLEHMRIHITRRGLDLTCVAVYPEADIKGIKIEPFDRYGLRISGKIQTTTQGDEIIELWRMLRESHQGLKVEEMQRDIEDAA